MLENVNELKELLKPYLSEINGLENAWRKVRKITVATVDKSLPERLSEIYKSVEYILVNNLNNVKEHGWQSEVQQDTVLISMGILYVALLNNNEQIITLNPEEQLDLPFEEVE